MASTTETGHAKNIANLKALNEILNGFGVNYNPSNPLIKLPATTAQYTLCDGLQGDVNTQWGIFKPIVNARQDEFKTMKPLVRRVRSAAKSCGAGNQFVKDVNTLVIKLLGERLSKPTPTATDPAGTSASQQSYDNVTNNMDALVKLLVTEPLYNPSKADLKVASLTAKQAAMKTKNDAVKVGAVIMGQALANRNKGLYTTTTGLCDVGQSAKDEVRSVFGFSSPEFKMVSKIQFKKEVDVD